jgi:hypothetical protein
MSGSLEAELDKEVTDLLLDRLLALPQPSGDLS